MPITRKPLLRAEILDELLNTQRWTGKELLQRLNEKLEDLDQKTIDERTLKRDLDFLEFEKRAPLHRPEAGDRVYYYTEKFSLKEVPLDGDELALLKQAVSILSRVENFKMMEDLDLIIAKLENRIHTNITDKRAVVQFEDHTHAKGINWFSDLFDAVREETVLKVNYQSFKHDEPKEYIVHPYLIKEYRNRWWLLGRDGNSKRILTLGLDRINFIKISDQKFIENNIFDPDTYFDKVIGVSIDYDAVPEEILLKVNPVSVQHVESKPIHKYQKIMKRNNDGSIVVKMSLIINYELKSTILGFGPGVEVLEPEHLKEEIKQTLEKTLALYRK